MTPPGTGVFTPKWWLAHILIALIAVGFVLLGLWQLDRHEGRLAANQTARETMDMPPVPIQDLSCAPAEGCEYRRVTITGTFLPEQEVLIRSQTHLGTAGFHVVTPFEYEVEPGRGVLVNRGWVPLGLEPPPIDEAAPPSGVVTIVGWVRLSQERPIGGASDPEGHATVFSRVNVERIQEQVDITLDPIHVVAAGEGGVLPEVVRAPDFDDTGPHLGYAIQWFGFALVGVVGYLFLIRRAQRARPSTTS